VNSWFGVNLEVSHWNNSFLSKLSQNFLQHRGLLGQLYNEIHIPNAVWSELNAGKQHWPGAEEVETSGYIYRHDIKNRVLATALGADLDNGESESIVLALELESSFLLMDEKEGRRRAQRLGLKVVGVVGILLEAKKRGMVKRICPLLDDLRQIG
jgi:predicted nucleic acid-binding protein